jgi:putative transposase
MDRPVDGIIKTVTIEIDNIGNWWVIFSCETLTTRTFCKTGDSIGIDVGINAFCVDSTGHKHDNPKYYHQSMKKLRKLQRSLSRKTKKSYRYKQDQLRIAKLHRHIANQREWFLHEIANYYLERYDTITIEDLSIQEMMKNRKGSLDNPRKKGGAKANTFMSRNIADAGWYKFFIFLEYKAKASGKEVIKIDPAYTTQICSSCGEKVFKTYFEKWHKCPYCGLKLLRKYNAALNIAKSVDQTEQALTSELSGVACEPCINGGNK